MLLNCECWRRLLRVPWTARRSNQSILKESWVFFGRTDVEAETPILWLPDAKSWLVWKDPDAGRDWGQEEKGTTEDKMARWHHRLDALEFGWTPGVGDGQGGLACCDSWGCKESTRLSDWSELNWSLSTYPFIFFFFLFTYLFSCWNSLLCSKHARRVPNLLFLHLLSSQFLEQMASTTGYCKSV